MVVYVSIVLLKLFLVFQNLPSAVLSVLLRFLGRPRLQRQSSIASPSTSITVYVLSAPDTVTEARLNDGFHLPIEFGLRYSMEAERLAKARICIKELLARHLAFIVGDEALVCEKGH